MRLRYNAPVIISFMLLAAAVVAFDPFTEKALTRVFFSVAPSFNYLSPLDYFRMISHVIGHTDWNHFIGNFVFILPLGPLLEEKYGSRALLLMMAITAAATGLLNAFFFSTGLLGASGIVFMLIILSSFTNFRKGEIPVTFLLIVILFVGKEIVSSLAKDNISQFAHLLGGACGSLFGFLFVRENKIPPGIEVAGP